MVRDGHGTDTENGYAHRTPFDGNIENVGGVVVVHGFCNSAQVSLQPIMLDTADEYFGEARFGGCAPGSTTTPACRIMDGKSGLIQVTFELEVGLLDELLILEIVGDGRQLARSVQGSHPF